MQTTEKERDNVNILIFTKETELVVNNLQKENSRTK